ncbi:unnamed protein product [Ceratitis capitata]|uniref:(Mediterranean fruit fly) hypothetical protein n=1 Tax=Ceratitis capitata TaxID=7213 RepID=A0A811V2B6_CERCA|nr:unnamed protein product [Ceratitis capitata]
MRAERDYSDRRSGYMEVLRYIGYLIDVTGGIRVLLNGYRPSWSQCWDKIGISLEEEFAKFSRSLLCDLKHEDLLGVAEVIISRITVVLSSKGDPLIGYASKVSK